MSPSRTLEGLYELTRRPSRALDSPCALLPELQRYKDTVRCGALGAEVPGHRQQQMKQTLIVRLSKTHFLHRSLILKSQQNRIELVTRPGKYQRVAMMMNAKWYSTSHNRCEQPSHLPRFFYQRHSPRQQRRRSGEGSKTFIFSVRIIISRMTQRTFHVSLD